MNQIRTRFCLCGYLPHPETIWSQEAINTVSTRKTCALRALPIDILNFCDSAGEKINNEPFVNYYLFHSVKVLCQNKDNGLI